MELDYLIQALNSVQHCTSYGAMQSKIKGDFFFCASVADLDAHCRFGCYCCKNTQSCLSDGAKPLS
jgi:hypothetical protein